MDSKKALEIKLLEKIRQENTESYNYVIPKIFSRKLIDYNSIRSDLLHVIEATGDLLLLTRNNAGTIILRTCMWHSIIITYGKCFTDATKSRRTRLDINSILPKEDDSIIGAHSKLMNLRHNYIAHGGYNEYDISVAFLKVPKENDADFKSSHYRIKSMRSALPSVIDLEGYRLLFQKVQEIVESKLKKNGERAHKVYMKLIKSTPLLPKHTRI